MASPAKKLKLKDEPRPDQSSSSSVGTEVSDVSSSTTDMASPAKKPKLVDEPRPDQSCSSSVEISDVSSTETKSVSMERLSLLSPKKLSLADISEDYSSSCEKDYLAKREKCLSIIDNERSNSRTKGVPDLVKNLSKEVVSELHERIYRANVSYIISEELDVEHKNSPFLRTAMFKKKMPFLNLVCYELSKLKDSMRTKSETETQSSKSGVAPAQLSEEKIPSEEIKLRVKEMLDPLELIILLIDNSVEQLTKNLTEEERRSKCISLWPYKGISNIVGVNKYLFGYQNYFLLRLRNDLVFEMHHLFEHILSAIKERESESRGLDPKDKKPISAIAMPQTFEDAKEIYRNMEDMIKSSREKAVPEQGVAQAVPEQGVAQAVPEQGVAQGVAQAVPEQGVAQAVPDTI